MLKGGIGLSRHLTPNFSNGANFIHRSRAKKQAITEQFLKLQARSEFIGEKKGKEKNYLILRNRLSTTPDTQNNPDSVDDDKAGST